MEKFWELRNEKNIPEEPFEASIKPGHLTHHAWTVDNLKNILKAGIVSGELGFEGKQPVAEDAETHYCADFFVSDSGRTIPEYIQFIGESVQVGALRVKRGENFASPTIRNDAIAFVIDPSQSGLEEILKYSGTGVDKGELEKFPVRFPREKDNHLAVLVGIPANFIKFIIVGGKLESNTEKIDEIKLAIIEAGLQIPIISTTGQRIG